MRQRRSPSRTAVRSSPAGDGFLPDLGELYESLNERHFRGALPACRCLWNSRLRTTAGRVDVAARVIELSVSYHRSFGGREVRDTLLHEMLHIEQAEGGGPVAHTREMKTKARRLGIRTIFAKDLPGRPPPRYRYRCPSCGRSVTRRIRIGRNRSACAHCCDRRNGGRWDPRFVLVLEGGARTGPRGRKRKPANRQKR